MLAKDLMIPLQESLTPEMTLKEAACILRTAKRGEETIGVKGLPVLDPAGMMVGFLSIGDILKAVFPPYMNLSSIGDFSWDGMVEEMARKVCGRRVDAIMTTAIISVQENAPLMVCIDHMVRKGVKRLPVVAADGRVTGILYERDVFAEITANMLGEGRECR